KCDKSQLKTEHEHADSKPRDLPASSAVCFLNSTAVGRCPWAGEWLPLRGIRKSPLVIFPRQADVNQWQCTPTLSPHLRRAADEDARTPAPTSSRHKIDSSRCE